MQTSEVSEDFGSLCPPSRGVALSQWEAIHTERVRACLCKMIIAGGMMEFESGNLNSNQYGDRFWIIECPDGWISLMADEIKTENGSLLAVCHSVDRSITFIGLCLAPLQWNMCFSANYNTGDPVAVYRWEKTKTAYKGIHGSAKRTRASRTIRELLLQRAGYKCQKCGRSQKDGAKLCVDHIIPKEAGGSSEEHNLQILCSKCNGRKSDNLE